MNPFLEFLRKTIGPGLTPGFNPAAKTPGVGADVLNAGQKTGLGGLLEKIGLGGGNAGGALPGPTVNAVGPRAPMDAVDGRANLQANVPEGLGDLNFQVNPNRQTVSAPEVDSRGKVKMSKVDNAPFDPVDYRNDPEGRDRRDYVIKDQLKERNWKDFLKPILAGAVMGGQSAARDPNAGGWDILGAAGAGAAVGGIANKIDPQTGSSVSYEAFQAPAFRAQRERQQLEQNRQFDDFQREQSMRMGAMNEELAGERIKDVRAQAAHRNDPRYVEVQGGMFDPATRDFIRNPFDPRFQSKPAGPMRVGDSLVQFDPVTNQPIETFRAPSSEKPLSFSERQREALADIETEDGASVEEIARASLAGREESLMQQLPKATRLILDKGKVMEGSIERDATPMEAQAAASLWQKMRDNELAKILRETKGVQRAKVSARISGGRGGSVAQPSGAGPRRPLAAMREKYLK